MNAPISNPADCEVRAVFRFLQAENVRPSEIHRRLVTVYGEHVMNAASVRKWCTRFRNGRTDVHDAERSGRPSVITDALNREPHHQRESTFHNQRSVRTMSGCVPYSCVRNCHRTFAIAQNLCKLGQAAFWYEGGISKLVSRYKCLIVQGDYVEKQVKVCDKTCILCFFPIINKYLLMAKRSLLSERPSYLLLFLYNGCTNAPQYYVIRNSLSVVNILGSVIARAIQTLCYRLDSPGFEPR